ncbi:MAG TPA: zinc ribbon domain-containing protein [Chloroflexi bacterium]|nr:zinc ribbon domain-containing protein [Chloroflexota bacterium]
MSVGSLLVGAALALMVGAYLARPFRRPEADLDRAIEQWVAQTYATLQSARPPAPTPSEGPVNFCPQCGRRVGPDDRFCAGCGTPLR